jgi:hypothetical protein
MSDSIAAGYLADALSEFRKLKKQGERAIAQVRDEDLSVAIDSEANSIDVIVKHLAGNMRSRWTDFLTTDGEKPDRHRDTEFEGAPSTTGEAVLRRWNEGWAHVFAALEPLSPDDLSRQVTIRGEPHTVVQAINRQLTHYAAHVGQIVLLAKHFCGPAWKTLSIARGKSAEYSRTPRP